MSRCQREPRSARWGGTVAGGLFAIVMLGAPPVGAEDREGFGRRLAGHRYAPSSLVVWGFIESQVSATSSFGVTELELELGRGPAALLLADRETRFVAVAQSFGGAAALTPWLGLTARVTASGLVPRDGVTALLVGATESYGGEAGISLGLLRAGSLQLIARGDAGWGFNRSTIPARLPDSPSVEGDIGTIRPSLIAALALTPAVGLQASASYAWRWFDVVEDDQLRTASGAVAATVVLAPSAVTLLLGGAVSRDYGRDINTVTSRAVLGNDATRWRGEVGLFYQGRHDLDLGAVAAIELDGDDTDRRLFGHLRIGYYF